MEPSRHKNGDRTETKSTKPHVHSEYEFPTIFAPRRGLGVGFWDQKTSNIDGKREAKTKTDPRAFFVYRSASDFASILGDKTEEQ